MMAAIKSERGMVEPAQERPKEVASGSGVRRAVPQQRQVSFFESLFGGGQLQRPSRRGRRAACADRRIAGTKNQAGADPNGRRPLTFR